MATYRLKHGGLPETSEVRQEIEHLLPKVQDMPAATLRFPCQFSTNPNVVDTYSGVRYSLQAPPYAYRKKITKGPRHHELKG